MTRDELYLEDILEAIARIDKYTSQSSVPLEQDELVQAWVLHHIQIIGEAVRSLSTDLKAQHPEVAWRDIVGTRNRLVHHYFDVHLPTIQAVVITDLPVLKGQIAAILAALRDADHQGSDDSAGHSPE